MDLKLDHLISAAGRARQNRANEIVIYIDSTTWYFEIKGSFSSLSMEHKLLGTLWFSSHRLLTYSGADRILQIYNLDVYDLPKIAKQNDWYLYTSGECGYKRLWELHWIDSKSKSNPMSLCLPSFFLSQLSFFLCRHFRSISLTMSHLTSSFECLSYQTTVKYLLWLLQWLSRCKHLNTLTV